MGSRGKRRYSRRYRTVFFEHNGSGPYPCCFCSEPVTSDEVTVHHEDEDRDNHSPDNLKAAHDDCHCRHHSGKEEPI